MSTEAQAAWVDRLQKLVKTPEWAELLKTKGLDDAYLGGADFGKFIGEEEARIIPVLKELGLAN